jgi:hypothetical protein
MDTCLFIEEILEVKEGLRERHRVAVVAEV